MPPKIESAHKTQARLYQPVLQLFMIKQWKQSQAGFYRRFALTVAASAGFFVSGQAHVGYLPTVGPSPLRFRPDFKPVRHMVATAPPERVEPPAPVLPAKMPAPALAAPTVEPAPTIVQPTAAVEPPSPEGVVSPQMLLKYFGRTTNADAAASAPLGFTPPRPVEAPSSKASYSTPPHQASE